MKSLKVAALLLMSTFVYSSCIGSYALFNKFAQWNVHATDSKFLNAIIGVVLLPVYGICSFADAFILNSIEFWTGDNPVAQKVGKTEQIMGQDGRYYAVKYMKNGYEITQPDGQVVKLVYDKKNKSWSQEVNGELSEIFRFNEDGTICATLPDGKKMNVTTDEVGLYQVRMEVNGGNFFAAR